MCVCECLCVCVYALFIYTLNELCVCLFFVSLSLLCCRHLHYNFIYKLNYAINYHGCLFLLLLSLSVSLSLFPFRFQLAISNSYNNISFRMRVSLSLSDSNWLLMRNATSTWLAYVWVWESMCVCVCVWVCAGFDACRFHLAARQTQWNQIAISRWLLLLLQGKQDLNYMYMWGGKRGKWDLWGQLTKQQLERKAKTLNVLFNLFLYARLLDKNSL